MEFLELCKKRYSVRKYSNKTVEKAKLDKMLAAGNTAPTAKNKQPHRIYVLQSENALKTVDKLTPCRYGAKTVLMFTYNTDEMWVNPYEADVNSGIEDVSIVATQIMLQGAELDVDTTWLNMFPNSEAEKAFNLPENEKVVLLMCVGYRADDAEPSPNHTNKKDLNAIVKYI